MKRNERLDTKRNVGEFLVHRDGLSAVSVAPAYPLHRPMEPGPRIRIETNDQNRTARLVRRVRSIIGYRARGTNAKGSPDPAEGE